jgi:hypothetical protein
MSRVRVFSLVFAGALLVGACGGQADVADTTIASTAPEAAAKPSSTTSTTVTTIVEDEFVPDYAALVAAVESAMQGTAYEGAALEDPEVFIATSELFCDLLDEGMTTDELLAEYLDRLSDGGVVEVDEDDGLMAGVLLGASIEIVCPEYSGEST